MAIFVGIFDATFFHTFTLIVRLLSNSFQYAANIFSIFPLHALALHGLNENRAKIKGTDTFSPMHPVANRLS